MRKERVIIVLIILIIAILGVFFTIKNINNDSVAASSNETKEIQENNKVDNVEQHQKESTTNIVKEDKKVQENKNEVNKFEKKSVEKSYFDDALFIGDSRTVGISEYGNLNNATFFANTGMSVYNVLDKVVSVPRVGKLNLEQLLKSKQFGKVYIMLGINELGYNMDKSIEKYKKLVEYVKNNQSSSIIYIQANLHVTSKKANEDKVFNNTNINKFNTEISKIADNKNIFYIDVNEKFDDENGNLNSEYTSDNIHIYAKYYKEWSNWISQNAVK